MAAKRRSKWITLGCRHKCVPNLVVVDGCVGSCRCGRLLRRIA